MGGEHEVAHDEAAVVDVGEPVLSAQYHKDGGGAVEGIEPLLPAADLGVGGGELVPQVLVGHGNDDGGLLPFAAGGVQARLDDLLQVGLGWHGGLEGADAAALLHGLQNFVHIQLPLSFAVWMVLLYTWAGGFDNQGLVCYNLVTFVMRATGPSQAGGRFFL